MSLIVYDENDNIITVLEDSKSINAFINGYYTVQNADHYEFI